MEIFTGAVVFGFIGFFAILSFVDWFKYQYEMETRNSVLRRMKTER